MSSVKDLKAILKLEKLKGNFTGAFSKMKKPELMSIVSSLGYTVAAKKTRAARAPKVFGPGLKRGMSYKTLEKRYLKSGNKQLNALINITAPKVVKPRVKAVLPGLKRGMTYKKLFSDYQKSGNTELEKAIVAAIPPVSNARSYRKKLAEAMNNPFIAPPAPVVVVEEAPKKKRRGRPRGSKNKPKA